VDLGKTGEIPVKEINKDKEAELPNQWKKNKLQKTGL